jgi:hypothetical protein
VADIIELEKRRRQQQDDKMGALHQEKINLLQKVLQCARCQLKCSRCGSQVKEFDENSPSGLPYPLCSGCRDEYEVYLKLSRGEITSACYWHNEEWRQVWGSWLKHQQALDRYRDSKEFIKLLREFDSLWSGPR